MSQKNWKIYNKSSEDMSETADSSVNLIVASVPYNDGTVYGKFIDKMPMEKYQNQMKNVIGECYRVINRKGILIIEAADTIISQGRFVQLAAMLQNMALETGFHLKSRHINFVQTKNKIETSPHLDSYISPPVTIEMDEAHSNACQWLIFSKEKSEFEKGKIWYENYNYSLSEHHCPFPEKLCQIFLKLGNFKPDQTILEPFMGTGTLGTYVIRHGGSHIGYEIDKGMFLKAKEKLKKA